MSVFIIVNEWTDINNDTSSEVTGANYFPTEDDAWEALSVIAESYGVDLDKEATNISLEDHSPHLQFEEYYIQELVRV